MKPKGFTLIELIITVAVVAILARIAYPSYTSYLARGKIADALASLGNYRIQMEQYFQDNRNYGTAGSACSVAAPASQYFTYTCQVGTPNSSFTATATSIAGALGSGTGDYTYSINEQNTKSTAKFQGKAVAKSCWLIRGNEC